MGGAEEEVARSLPLWCNLASSVASTPTEEKRRVGADLPAAEEERAVG